MRFKSLEQLQKWQEQAKAQPQNLKAPRQEQEVAAIDPNVQRRILGVDTALRCTGWGMIDVRGNAMKAVDCGVIRNSSKLRMSECLRNLSGGIRELVQLYHPDIAVLEGAFYFENVRTAMMLGSARGSVIAALAENGITIYEYAPRRIKQAVCGNGSASKRQVAILVSQFLNIRTDQFALDATDALSMAICHALELTTAGGLALPKEL